MTGPISRDRLLGSLKEAASWPGADRNTVVTLAGFFQVRAGENVAAAITKLDKAATMDLGLPQYLRGLALAELLRGAGRSEAGPLAADTGRADQVIADLEFVFAARDQFPVLLLRAAYQGLAALADLGLKDRVPVSHLILTHAHFDHIGGTAAVRGPGTQVIASAGFPAEAQRQRQWSVPRSLTGAGVSPVCDVQPDRLISERTSLVVGDTEFVLIPVRGGETPDALMVHLPASGLLFTGDALMPYTTLTENFTIETLAGLEPALTELHEFALARIGENMPLPDILDRGYLPALLRDHPAAVVPYLVSRDNFIARLYHQRTGYWLPDGQGLDPRSQEERAAALDLLAGEKADSFRTAAATLAGQGDLTLALEILTPGLLRHPGSSELAELRQAVVVRLMEQRQLLDPFGFLVYAELAGAEFSPVR
jgi:glyoxylase-like metal-dependent hydrolase (beta-lactamase superfamily II)